MNSKTDQSLLDLQVASFKDEWNSMQSIIVKSSGSTGVPKEFLLDKSLFIKSANRTCDYFNIGQESKLFLALSPETIAGKMMIIRSIVSGCELINGELSKNPIKNYSGEIDFIAVVPMQLEEMIHHEIEKLRRIKTILVGGAPLSPTLELLITENKLNVYHSYGMTETVSHVALRQIIENNNSFKSLDGVRFSVNSENQLIINDSLLCIKELKTNDIVELINETQFVWKGRTDFMINSGGIKLNPEVVERKLSKCIDIPFFCIGLNDETLGNKLVLFVANDNFKTTREELKKYLSSEECPKEVYTSKSFYYTESGKIDKQKIISKIVEFEKSVL